MNRESWTVPLARNVPQEPSSLHKTGICNGLVGDWSVPGADPQPDNGHECGLVGDWSVPGADLCLKNGTCSGLVDDWSVPGASLQPNIGHECGLVLV